MELLVEQATQATKDVMAQLVVTAVRVREAKMARGDLPVSRGIPETKASPARVEAAERRDEMACPAAMVQLATKVVLEATAHVVRTANAARPGSQASLGAAERLAAMVLWGKTVQQAEQGRRAPRAQRGRLVLAARQVHQAA